MISAEDFLAAHPASPVRDDGVPDAVDADGTTRGPRQSGGAFGASRDGDAVRFARGARRAGKRRNGLGPGKRASGGFDGDAVRFARGARRAGKRRNGLGPGKRASGGFAYTPAEDPRDGQACKEAALRLLDAAPRSSGGLRGKLAERGYADDVIGAVIDRLVELRLLDDEEYARSVVRACVNRMMGKRGAILEMTRKGVDDALARRIADEAAAEGVFDDAAWELGRHVANRTRGKDPQTAKRRFWSAGGRKGHDPAVLRDEGVFDDAAWELGRHVANRTRGKDPQTAKRRFWSAGGRKGHDPAVLRDVSDVLFQRHGAEGEEGK